MPDQTASAAEQPAKTAKGKATKRVRTVGLLTTYFHPVGKPDKDTGEQAYLQVGGAGVDVDAGLVDELLATAAAHGVGLKVVEEGDES